MIHAQTIEETALMPVEDVIMDIGKHLGLFDADADKVGDGEEPPIVQPGMAVAPEGQPVMLPVQEPGQRAGVGVEITDGLLRKFCGAVWTAGQPGNAGQSNGR